MLEINQGARFEIGRVPQAMFGVLGRNFLNFLILSAVLLGVPGLINQLLNNYAATHPEALLVNALLRLATAVITVVFSFVLQAALVGGTISDLNGRKQTLGEMIAGKAVFVPTLFGLAIAQGLITGLAFLLLLAPGLFAMTVWIVTVPAVVIDRRGVFEAFSRSAELTRGNRWSIFALIIVYFVVAIILGSVGLVLMGGVQGAAAAARLGVNPLLIGYNVVSNVLLGMVSATGIAVIYYELRRVREGVAPQALVDTFS